MERLSRETITKDRNVDNKNIWRYGLINLSIFRYIFIDFTVYTKKF